MLDRRLQVLIDEDRWERLEAESSRRRVAVSVLVRQAIDECFPAQLERRSAALRSILEAEPMDVPDVDDLRRELDAIRGRGAT